MDEAAVGVEGGAAGRYKTGSLHTTRHRTHAHMHAHLLLCYACVCPRCASDEWAKRGGLVGGA